MNLDELRKEIQSLSLDPSRLRTEMLQQTIIGVQRDITAVITRGVSWKRVSETVSRYLGFNVSPDTLRNRYRRLLDKQVEPEALSREPEPQVLPLCCEATDVQSEEKTEENVSIECLPIVEEKTIEQKTDQSPWKNAANWRKDEEKMGPVCNSGQFLTAATSPDGRLYQLEHRGRATGTAGGGYGVFEVDPSGNLSICAGEEFPHFTPKKLDAIKIFCDWARSKGYELMGHVA